MTDREIEVEGRELRIVTDGRVLRSPVPKDFNPRLFRHIVAAVDMLYRETGIVPAPSEIVASWEGFDEAVVKQALASKEMIEALSHRGIEWDAKRGLTLEQLNALLVLQDPTDGRGTAAKLKQLGVSNAKYRAWMKNPAFKRQLNLAAEENLEQAVQVSINRMIANAESGDMRAIEKVLEITGRWNPQQQEIHNARKVLEIFVEALEKHASPDVLKSVLDEVNTKTRMLTITSSPSNMKMLKES